MGEEATLYHVFCREAESPEQRAAHRAQLERIMCDVRRRGPFRIEQPPEITAFLVLAMACERAAVDAADLKAFIRRNVVGNPMTYPANIAYVTINSTLLEALGHQPRMSSRIAFRRGLIATMAADRSLVPLGKRHVANDGIDNFFYDFTHEIFAAACFGDTAPARVMTQAEMAFTREVIARGLSHYRRRREMDILGELVICASMMGVHDGPLVREALRFIIAAQHDDGSFGPVPRMKRLGRKSVYRHGVLVAAWALAVQKRGKGTPRLRATSNSLLD